MDRARWPRWARLILGCLLSYLGFCSWWPELSLGQCHGIVILASGTAGYWPDVGTYTQLLKSAGIPHRLMAPCQRSLTRDWMIRAYQSGEIQEPIVVVGYSQGSGESVRLARRLGEAGIPVTSLLLLEAGGEFTISANVRKCLNIYTSNPATDRIPLLRGLQVHAESPATQVVNWDVRLNPPQQHEIARQRHLALGNSIPARQILMQYIQAEFTPHPFRSNLMAEPIPQTAIGGDGMELCGSVWDLGATP